MRKWFSDYLKDQPKKDVTVYTDNFFPVDIYQDCVINELLEKTQLIIGVKDSSISFEFSSNILKRLYPKAIIEKVTPSFYTDMVKAYHVNIIETIDKNNNTLEECIANDDYQLFEQLVPVKIKHLFTETKQNHINNYLLIHTDKLLTNQYQQYLRETASTGPFDHEKNKKGIEDRYELLKHAKLISRTSDKSGDIRGIKIDNVLTYGFYPLENINVPGGKTKYYDFGAIAFVVFEQLEFLGKKYIDIILAHNRCHTQNIAPKLDYVYILLQWMKHNYHLPFIDFTGYQSDEGQLMFKKMKDRGEFKFHWIDITTGEIDSSFDDPKYRKQNQLTNWRLVFEVSDLDNPPKKDLMNESVLRGLPYECQYD